MTNICAAKTRGGVANPDGTCRQILRADAAHLPGARVRMPAKINAHLGVFPGRDARGYHRADSIMIAVGIYDTVSVREAAATTITYDPPVNVRPTSTATWQAVSRLSAVLNKTSPLAIAVSRTIPSESGLGSASADAAAAIRACCALWDVDTCSPVVTDVARSVGADVAFFLKAAPAYFTGVGDQLAEVFPSVVMPVVLVRPRGGVQTASAYTEFDRDPIVPRSAAAMRDALRRTDPIAIAHAAYNNLAPAATRIEPGVACVLAWLQNRIGVRVAQVTGSGSCVFALCETDALARTVAADAARAGWWSYATRTVDATAVTVTRDGGVAASDSDSVVV